MLRVLDLFSGIGGFSLGLERTGGFKTVAFCEIDPYCQAVLRKHWPSVPVHADVQKLARIDCDVIAGGFPCQDISHAGRRLGLGGERSGLWRSFARLVGELRPRYVIVENVAAITVRGLLAVLGDLTECGYDTEWRVFGANDIGAPQRRKRLWLLAYPNNARFQGPVWAGQPNATRAQWKETYREPLRSACGYWPPGPSEVVHVPRMADGPAHRVDRLRAIGNAVVPQIVEIIGHAILEAEGVKT